MNLSVRRGALLAVLVVIAACQRNSAEHAVPPKAEAASQPLTVQEVQIGNDSVEAEPLTTNKPIHISISIKGTVAKTSQLKAKLFNLRQGRVAGEQIYQVEAASVPGKINFSFQNPKGWEPGRYLVEWTLNGKLLKHQELDIFQAQEQSSTTNP